ncbi:uncharacterized protein J7T54_001412 [Emericellopsis cladophorae]|uniref:Protein BTN n=1 Tax=Emericellopsis cladophorae TaxID=2686198 RepID=A0A9P9Y154_9HYPO|nr:uncharacterized protein J7T54_001412 [Emericellopsis cladophorae]KAI6781450.1 hypothetical protein J7T54_001412 [Emericellopsis cladophorae]
MPGAPSSSWGLYTARIQSLLRHPDMKVVVAFWLFGLINNVLYVIILSAAQDLVGSVPKGVVLLADVLPSFLTKLIAPYFIHRIPYNIRVLVFIALSAVGMLMVALTPPSKSVAVKMAGVVLASLSSGGGAAGLVGAGLYVVLTEWWGFSVKDSLLFSACLPVVMFVSFFVILPRGPLRDATRRREYDALPDDDDDESATRAPPETALLNPEPGAVTAAYPAGRHPGEAHSLTANLKRARALVVPYMMPLFLVYVAEYTINQGVAPTLLFPVEESPFREFRGFYPFYGFLYQLGVFISRSSTPFIRILYFFIPSVYIVFVVIFWEGLLGGAVLGAATVSDSGGICVAALIGIALEPRLCAYQVAHGRDWCRQIKASHS